LTTADDIRVVGLDLRLTWDIDSRGRPETSRYRVELFRVATLVADLSIDRRWHILVSDGFHARQISPGRWRIVTGVRIEPASSDPAEQEQAIAVLDAAALLL
jgi:hypothetical protein